MAMDETDAESASTMPRRYRIPMSAPDIRARDIELVTQALRSGTLSGGPFLERLEREFAAYIGVRHAVAVANGTAGLHLCVRAGAIADGDEVITTPFSFVASANCILYERAKPVFVDIDETTFNLDPVLARAAVTDRTRAVLPVHLFGQPCAMDELQALCRESDLLLIEDACEAVGAEYRGRKVGRFGKAAVFAFYPNKPMTMGEGAIIATDDPRWAALFRSLRNQGRGDQGAGFAHDHLGYNYRLDEMSAALGVAQLARLDDLLARRQEVAARYGELLRKVPGMGIRRIVPSTTRMSWFVYVVRLDPAIDRDRVIAQLEKRQIASRAYFAPIHLQPVYQKRFGFRKGDFPIAERVAASTLALPFHANLSSSDIEAVVDALQSAAQFAAA
jgi:perosamine synthetase